MRKILACPGCGSAVVPAIVQPPPRKYLCLACGMRSFREDLKVIWDFMKSSHGHAHGHAPGAGGGSLVTTHSPTDFPRIWYYFNTTGAGSPIMTSPGVFDSVFVNQLGKFHAATLNITPYTNTANPENAGVVDRLRAINPSIKLYWYGNVQQQFSTLTAGTAWGEFYNLVIGAEDGGLGNDRTLKQLDGGNYAGGFGAPLWWDIPMDGGAAKLLAAWTTYAGHRFVTGFFLDIITNEVRFPAAPDPDSVDFAAHGYGTNAALGAALRAAYLTLTNGLVPLGEVYGNRSGYDSATTTNWTGELVEQWDPGQGTASDTQLPLPGTYATFDDAMNYILAWKGSSATGNGSILLKAEYPSALPTSAGWQKMARYVLGSACIAGGLAHVGKGADGRQAGTAAAGDGIFANADEYAVDSTGRTDSTRALANMGWLGRPTEFGAKDATSGMYVRRFQNGIVVLNGPAISRNITLERPYRRISGFYDPTTNDGSLVTTLTVPQKDARFLLRT